MSENTVVNMDHFDVDTALEQLARQRYQMPPAVIAALRQAGSLAAQRLLNLVADEKAFNSLPAKDRLKLLEMVLDRAYGRAETASTNDLAQAKLSNDPQKQSDHARQIEEINARQKVLQAQNQRRGLPQDPASVLRAIDNMSGRRSVPPAGDTSGEGGASLPRNRPVPPARPQGRVVELRRSHEGADE